jgi:uncharacterized membrane protein YfcA
MNEQAVAFVCAIFSAICAILYWYHGKETDWGAMVVGSCFAVIIVLLSAYVLICRYL